MSEPKFRVGEEVLILSEHKNPGIWEEDTIVAIRYWPGRFRFPNSAIIFPPGYSYAFTDGTGAPEKYIRKKHKPGDSFESIMNECRQPIGERV